MLEFLNFEVSISFEVKMSEFRESVLRLEILSFEVRIPEI